MSVYVLTHLAKADIFDIWSYIADDNEEAADSVRKLGHTDKTPSVVPDASSERYCCAGCAGF